MSKTVEAVSISESSKSAFLSLRMWCTHLFVVAFLTGGLALAGAARASSDTDASIKVAHGDELKGKSTVAIGAYRVAFVTQDAANAVTRGMFGGSAAMISGELVGADRALMQKIADDVFVDFLKQSAAKGYSVIESSTLASTAQAYAALTPWEFLRLDDWVHM